MDKCIARGLSANIFITVPEGASKSLFNPKIVRKTLVEFEIPAKLIRLMKLSMTDPKNVVRVEIFREKFKKLSCWKLIKWDKMGHKWEKDGIHVHGRWKPEFSHPNWREAVEEFIYLGSLLNTNNDCSEEIKRRLLLTNRYYFGFQSLLKSKLVKDLLQNMVWKAVPWKMLGRFERKILRTNIGAVRLRYKLYDIYKDTPIVNVPGGPQKMSMFQNSITFWFLNFFEISKKW